MYCITWIDLKTMPQVATIHPNNQHSAKTVQLTYIGMLVLKHIRLCLGHCVNWWYFVYHYYFVSEIENCKYYMRYKMKFVSAFISSLFLKLLLIDINNNI